MTSHGSGPVSKTFRLGSGMGHPAELASRTVLVVYHRNGAEIAPLRRGKALVVGRTPGSDLVIRDESLSRRHASFEISDEGIRVEDLGSTNGTWLRGQSVGVETLSPGDTVLLGDVTAVVQAIGGEPRLGLDGHDGFVGMLRREVVRGRHFGRPVALMMIRAADRGVGLHTWAQSIPELVRSVDGVALYGGDIVEVLLPETTAGEARELAAKVLASRQDVALLAGVGAMPESATSAESLLEACRHALKRATSAEPVVVAPSGGVTEERGPASTPPSGIVSESEAMRQLLVMARRVARGHIPLLLHGETGTGKEVLAKLVHHEGPRADKAQVTVNCAAIPASLVESTLFGHMKGAFTGAHQSQPGVFEAAEGGTVFLDEIGELPAQAQAALLRVLESKTIVRVGSTKEQRVDVRIVAASHRDLEQMVERGEFREDLLYRLNAIVLELPPLRERREDILPLARGFLRAANEENAASVATIEPDAAAALEAADWPGNIRELKNAIDRAVVIAESDSVKLRDLPERVRSASFEVLEGSMLPPLPRDARLRGDGESFRACMERLETAVLTEAIDEVGGNQTEAAKQLDMPRRTLVHKIKVLGVKR